MGKIKDLTGQNFGRLTALRQAGMNQHHEMTWECRCSCGNIAIVSGAALRKGSTKSCGCLHREAMQNKRQKNIFYYKNDVAVVTIDGADGKMLCDKEDWERNKHLYWRLYNSGYAGTSNRVLGGKCINTFFHHEVLECPEGMYRDHINRNRLDNRSCNLRVVSPYESVLNRGMSKNNTSGVKGVTYNEKKNRWIAQICKDGKGHSLGYFKNIEDARAARIAGEVKYFGKVVS